MTDTTVRRATAEDLEAILDLWQEMMDYHESLDVRFRSTVDRCVHFLPIVQEWMTDETYHVLVAEANDRVVGYIIGRISENPPIFELRHFGYVTDICVAPEWRRRGVGRKLFAALRDWFHRHGLTVVQLNVSALNSASQGFWRAMGFQDYLDRMWLDL